MGDGNKKDWYFANTTVRGVGDMFLLLLPQELGRGSDAGKLIGSVVCEVDYGFIIKKQCPEPVSAAQPGLAIRELARAAGVKPAEMKGKRNLAGAELNLDSVKKFTVDGKANFPGSPVAGGVQVDWKKIKSVDISFGAGTYALDLRKGLVERGLKAARLRQAEFAPELFDKDFMIISSVLIARGLNVLVTSEKEFTGEFQAAATAATQTHAELAFEQKSTSSYLLKVAADKEYLIGVAAIEPEEMS